MHPLTIKYNDSVQPSIIDKMHEIAEDRGGKCLSDEYKHSRHKLLWKCSQGHKWEAQPTSIKRGTWCPVCATDARRRTIREMQDVAAERGGRCLSETYNGAITKLWWECAEEHKWEATPGSVAHGSWCPSCAGNVRYTIEDMQIVAADRGGKCLSDAYINSQTKLHWECREGHRWEATPNKIKSGSWCPKCNNNHRGDYRKLTIEEMSQIAVDRGGRCLSEIYVNTRTKLKWECSEGHRWEAAPANAKKGSWCPECYVSPLTTRKQERSK